MSRRLFILILILSCGLNLMAHLPAAAQRADLLLSHDQIVLALPPDIAIQDAAGIDSTIFAVWGSTQAVSDIDLSGFVAGTYLLEYHCGEVRAFRKVLIIH